MEDQRPPKPRLTIRVGVTGHRLEALQKLGFDEELLRFSIREVLARIRISVEEVFRRNRDVYSDEAPVLRIISPLAEGADQFVAQEGRKLGFEIQSPIPIDPNSYKQILTNPDSKVSFDELLGEATSVFVIEDSQNSKPQLCETVGRDDSQAIKPQLYEAVGRVVLRQSDLLIAVWDGVEEKGQGGTGQVVREALSKQIPTVWLSANPPHPSALLEKITEEGKAEDYKSLNTPMLAREIDKRNRCTQLQQDLFKSDIQPPIVTNILDGHLRKILEPPGREEWQALQQFFNEHQLEFQFECEPETKWGNDWTKHEAPNSSVGQHIVDNYWKPFLCSDVTSKVCAKRYRNSFGMTYILGALAVLSAFLGSHYDVHSWFFVELAFIFGILALVQFSRIGRWHERWMDYRLLAEGLRQMRVLAPFARVTPSFEAPAHLLQDSTDSTWFNWYFRATVRQAGLIKATVNKDYLDTCRNVLTQEISSQIDYHKGNEIRNEELHSYLHGASFFLFLATFTACLLHLADKKKIESILGEHADGLLTLCAIVLPAFGAAIQGIVHQGEYGRLARRSGSIRRRLEALLSQVATSSTGNSFKTLGRFARSFSEIQIQEQTDWRSVFRGKGVSLP